MKDNQTHNDEVRHLRVLLYGPVGAGKSRCINSVSNVVRGKMTNPALASTRASDKSSSKRVPKLLNNKLHQIQKLNKLYFFGRQIGPVENELSSFSQNSSPTLLPFHFRLLVLNWYEIFDKKPLGKASMITS